MNAGLRKTWFKAAAFLLVAGCAVAPLFAESIVINGDFSDGNTGFSSNYSYVAPTNNALYPEGLYTVGTNPHVVHNNWLTMGDHTGSGNMFIANGSPSTSAIVWQGTVDRDLTIGLSYDFSAWVVDVLSGDPAPPTLTFKADGVTIGTYSPTGNSWTRLSGSFTATTNRPALTLTNAQPAANGNDFAIDDIEIWFGGAPIPSTLPTTTTLVTSPDPSNIGDSVLLTATVSPSAATGTVTFKEGATTLGTGAVIGGVATMTTSAFSVGVHSLTAEYGGDSAYDPSSGSDTQTVLDVEIDVQRPVATSIADGGTDNIGNQNAGTTPDLIYTITNAGPGVLHVTGVTATTSATAGGFTVDTPLPFDIASGSSHTLEITFNVIDGGPFTVDMHIVNNDRDENPYDIHIAGTGLADFGDAPGSYSTLLASNGARHKYDSRIRLGSTITLEADGQPSANADADAGDDGVSNPTYYRGITASVPVSVTNTTGSQAYLNAWIDWNRDGDWNDAGEQIATNRAVSAGSNTLNVNVPYGASVGESFGLFRLSTQQNLLPTGLADNGEAETFKVTIAPVSVSLLFPDNGGDFMGGSDLKVKWLSDPAGISTITLKYSTDWGVTFPNVIVPGTDNDGEYVWTLPKLNTNQVQIKVEVDGWQAGLAAAEDISANHIAIDSTPPTGKLIEPVCGTTFHAGDTMNVQWQSSDNLQLLDPALYSGFRVSLQYSLDNWTTFPVMIADHLDNSGLYRWPIPLDLVSDNFEIKVRVMDVAGNVTCLHMCGPMRILPRSSQSTNPNNGETNPGDDIHAVAALNVSMLSPQGGERWEAGTTHEIQALTLTTGDPDTVLFTLSYSQDGGASFSPIMTTLQLNDTLNYSWTAPNSLNSDSVLIKIEARNNFGLAGKAVTPKKISVLNSPPKILSIPDTSFYNDGTFLFCLNAFVQDNNDDLQTLSWSAVSDNDQVNVMINQDNKNCLIKAEGFIGTAQIVFTVVDPQLGSATDTLAVSVFGETTTGIADNQSVSKPTEYRLYANYPNPFNPRTEIQFAIPEDHSVTLKIYNLFGQEIRTLVDGEFKAGYHTAAWDGKDQRGNLMSSGIYLYKIQAGKFSSVKRMSLLK